MPRQLVGRERSESYGHRHHVTALQGGLDDAARRQEEREATRRTDDRVAVLIRNHTAPHMHDGVDTGRPGDIGADLDARNAKALFDAKQAWANVNDAAFHREACYAESSLGVFELSKVIRSVAERRLAELDRLVHDHFGNRAGAEPVPMDELLKRARSRQVVILDTRPASEYIAGHIASLAYEQLTRPSIPSYGAHDGVDVHALKAQGRRVGTHEDRSRWRETAGLAMGLNEFAGYVAVPPKVAAWHGSPST